MGLLTSVNPDSGETVNEYYKRDDIKVMLTENQGVMLVFCRELLSFNAQLRNVRDRRGNRIVDFGQQQAYFFIGSPTVQFDVFGNTMGYKYTLTRKVAGTTVVNN